MTTSEIPARAGATRHIGRILIAAVVGWATLRVVRRTFVEPYIDFEAFYLAGRAVLEGTDIYRAGVEMYIYPPMLAAWISPLTRLPLQYAALLWYTLAVSTTLLSLLLFKRILADRLPSVVARSPFALVLGAAMVLWVDQFRWEFEQGQCDWLLLAAYLVALACLDRLPIVSGLALGFAINVKYLPIVMVFYLLLRKRWSAAAWSVAGTAAWALAPALIYGWDRNLRYLAGACAGLGKLVGLHFANQPGMIFPLTYEYSISLPSGAARLAELYGWGAAGLTALVAIALAAAWFVGCLIYRAHGVNLFHARGGEAERSDELRGVVALEWLGLSTLMLTFSPQTHNRHMFLLLPLVVLGVQLFLDSRSGWARTLCAVGLAAGCLAPAIPLGTAAVEPGEFSWRLMGGGSIGMLTMYFVFLAAALKQTRFAALMQNRRQTYSKGVWGAAPVHALA